jgi:hypothetical protein
VRVTFVLLVLSWCSTTGCASAPSVASEPPRLFDSFRATSPSSRASFLSAASPNCLWTPTSSAPSPPEISSSTWTFSSGSPIATSSPSEAPAISTSSTTSSDTPTNATSWSPGNASCRRRTSRGNYSYYSRTPLSCLASSVFEEICSSFPRVAILPWGAWGTSDASTTLSPHV